MMARAGGNTRQSSFGSSPHDGACTLCQNPGVARPAAIRTGEKARSANPEHPLPHAYLASAYALKSEGERAAGELDQARKLCGDDRYSSIARLKAKRPFGAPKIRALFEGTYLAGLRKAGMAE